jgi:hypothetical protein
MKPNTDGLAQPDLIKEAESAPKTRTYKNADGTEIKLTDEQFAIVLEFYKELRKMRDEKSTQPDDVEPVLATQDKANNVKRKAG